jgi:plasmid stabilization system protein ParE
MKLLYTERANDDIDLAISWYGRQSPGLGLIFLDLLKQAVSRIIDNPKS